MKQELKRQHFKEKYDFVRVVINKYFEQVREKKKLEEEVQVRERELLRIIGKEPLFGHPNGSKIPTHWFCFMKIPEEEEIEK